MVNCNKNPPKTESAPKIGTLVPGMGEVRVKVILKFKKRKIQMFFFKKDFKTWFIVIMNLPYIKNNQNKILQKLVTIFFHWYFFFSFVFAKIIYLLWIMPSCNLELMDINTKSTKYCPLYIDRLFYFLPSKCKWSIRSIESSQLVVIYSKAIIHSSSRLYLETVITHDE